MEAGDGKREINYIDRDWVAANPIPTLDDDGAVIAWLDAFRDDTTDLWLTLFEPTGTTDADDTYTDVRSAD